MLVISAGSMMHMLIAIVLLFIVYVDQRASSSRRPAPRSARSCAGGPAADGRHRRPATSIVSRRRRSRSTTPSELGAAVRAHEPGDVVDARRRARRRRADRRRSTLGANTDDGSPMFGTAFLGVSSRTARPSGSRRVDRRGRRRRSVTDLVPDRVGERRAASSRCSTRSTSSTTSPARTTDPATRPTTVVGVTPGQRRRSATTTGLVGDPAHARRAQRLRRRVQPVPAAAVRRRPRGDRHLRADPLAQRPSAVPRRRRQADAGHDGRDRRCSRSCSFAGLYLDIAKPIG